MNPQDPVGQAAAANTARQRGDYDDDWDDGGYWDTDFTAVLERQIEKERKSKPTVERLISPTGETASIKWSRVDERYVLTISDKDLVALFCDSYHQVGLHAGEIPSYVTILERLGYKVEVEWRPI